MRRINKTSIRTAESRLDQLYDQYDEIEESLGEADASAMDHFVTALVPLFRDLQYLDILSFMCKHGDKGSFAKELHYSFAMDTVLNTDPDQFRAIAQTLAEASTHFLHVANKRKEMGKFSDMLGQLDAEIDTLEKEFEHEDLDLETKLVR